MNYHSLRDLVRVLCREANCTAESGAYARTSSSGFKGSLLMQQFAVNLPPLDELAPIYGPQSSKACRNYAISCSYSN